MNIMKIVSVDDADLIGTNVPVEALPDWDGVTEFAAEAQVLDTAQTWIYQSTQAANIGNDPATDDGTWWTPVRKVAPLRPFDGVISNPVTGTDSATFVIRATTVVDTIAFFNLSASCVKVEVYTPGDWSDGFDWHDFFYTYPNGKQTASVTKELFEVSDYIYDAWTYLFADLSDVSLRETIVTGFFAFPGQEIHITIGAEGENVEVGEILLGSSRSYGEIIEGGTESEIRSYSSVDIDTFGNVSIVERDPVRAATFEIYFPFEAEGRVLAALQRQVNKLAVFHGGNDLIDRGLLTYGFFSSVSLPHRAAGVSKLTIQITAVVGRTE